MCRYCNLKIRHKLQCIVMLTCTVALLISAAVLVWYDRASFLRERTQDLNASAQMVGSNSTAALTFGDAQSASEILRALTAKQYVINACIFDRDGKVFAKYARSGSPSDFIPPPPGATGASVSGPLMALFQPIVLNGKTIGTIFVQADLTDLKTRMVRFTEISSLVLVFSLCIAFLLSSRLQRVISDPIRELAETAALVSQRENYSIRAAKSSNDEIGFLFDQFNGMLDRIQQRDHALQQAHDELERRVAERTAYLNALIENSPLAILAMDTQERVQFCNPAFESLFQYSRAEAIGMPIASLIQPAEDLSDPRFADLLDAASSQTGLITQRRRKDHSVVDVELHAVGLTLDGQPAGWLAIYQDVSVRKRAEEAMQKAKDAAEAASRAKSEFLANMSHEIRTPMNGIMGMTELVLDTQLDPEQRNYLNLAKISADSLLQLINDILDYSKIEAGRLEIDAIDFNLGNSLGETMKTLSLRAHQKGLELAFEIQPDVPDALIGDPGRLRQIIVNLTGNAIKFTDNGEVVLYVETESRTDDSALLHFTVADTGIGIPVEKQVAIFEPFRQADGSMTRKYGGTGLGLTISSRLVDLMGGKIWVESEVGRGSRFHFTARFGVQKNPTRTIVPRDPVTLQGMRVLVVDDNATNREILLKMLENWHMVPTAVESGAKAIVTLREATGLGRMFPLILLDAQMPEMDGFALAEAIKRNPDWRSATIMMLSSAGQRGDALRCRELGVSAYLTKPVQQPELLEAILIALGTRPQKKEQNPALVTKHSLREHRSKLRILLVEDNAVNQLVAVRLLEKYGHSVRVAANGKKALAALEQETFDAVLMDVQMPEMNGWEATQAIREKEKITGAHMPVVAMTAHAMKGDEERCLAAGMDTYLTKPLQTQKLLAVLDDIARQKIGNGPALGGPSKRETNGIMDVEAALQRFEGDRDLLEQVALLFRQECPRLLREIHAAIASDDAEDLARRAHTLKGSSANLNASAVTQAAAELEKAAEARNMQRANSQVKLLETEIDRLFGQLEAISAR